MKNPDYPEYDLITEQTMNKYSETLEYLVQINNESKELSSKELELLQVKIRQIEWKLRSQRFEDKMKKNAKKNQDEF